MMSADALLCFGSNTQISVVVLCCVVVGRSVLCCGEYGERASERRKGNSIVKYRNQVLRYTTESCRRVDAFICVSI
jgi:hypothetical protein